MKILRAIDESPCAEVAVREVEERFTMRDTTVRVLHIVEKFVPPAATLWYDGVGNPKAAHAKVVDHYQRFVDRIAERLTSRGISTETVVKEGDPGKLIVYEATEMACELDRFGLAEGLLRHEAGDRFEVVSAGVERTYVRPEAVEAMREIGVDISQHRSKFVDEFAGKNSIV